jgi:hypothetical protein
MAHRTRAAMAWQPWLAMAPVDDIRRSGAKNSKLNFQCFTSASKPATAAPSAGARRHQPCLIFDLNFFFANCGWCHFAAFPIFDITITGTLLDYYYV